MQKFKIEYHPILPDDLFANRRTFPLELDHLPIFDSSLLPQLTEQARDEIVNGKHGDVQDNVYPWAFTNGFQVHSPCPDHFPLCTLELVPPPAGVFGFVPQKTFSSPNSKVLHGKIQIAKLNLSG